MRRLLRLTLASLVVMSACTPPDSALRVTVQVRNPSTTNRVRADCLKLTVSNDTQELKALTIRIPADGEAVFGVRRGKDLPQTVRVQAFGYFGDCNDEATLKLNAQGDAVSATFPETGVETATIFLDPPSSSLDADRDGYVAGTKGGIDCRDDDNSIYPGATQVCATTSDTDCDGLGGCDDSECGSATVCAEPPDRVLITSTLTTMLRHECVGPFLVQLANDKGARVAVRSTAVTLTTDKPGVTVHDVSNCMGAPIPQTVIPYGNGSFEVYLKADGMVLGPTRLTATAAQVASAGATTIDVRPQPVASIAFTSPPRTVRAGECSAEPITLELRDAQGRRTDVENPAVVSMAAMPNANIFFSDAACTTDAAMTNLTAGQGAVTLYVKASLAATYNLTANPGIVPAQSQMLTVTPASPSKLAFANDPLVLNSTVNCSAGELTVQVQDAFNNPVPVAAALPVRVQAMGLTGVEFYSSSTCMGAPQQDFMIPAGSSSVALRANGRTASATPGSVSATVTNGAPITGATQTLSIAAGDASRFDFSGGPFDPLASVCSAMPFTIQLRDATGNVASSQTPTVFTLSTIPAADASFGFFSGAGCQTNLNGVLTIPAGQSSGTFYFRGNRAIPSFEVRASSTLTAPTTWPSGNRIRPNVPGRLVFVPPASQTTQAGGCTSTTYVANVLDLYDNPTSFPTTQTVAVASSPAGARVGTGGTCDQNSVLLPANATQATFNAGHTVTGTYSLVATVANFSTSPGVSLTVTPGPSQLIADVPLNGTTNIVAGNCQTVTLSRRDMFNNNAPVATSQVVTLGFPAQTTWLVYPASNNCSGAPGGAVTIPANSHTVTFSVSPRTAGSHQVPASIGSASTLQTALLTFNVAPAAPTLVFLQPASGMATQTAGGCTTVTVARRDAFQNDVPLGTGSNLTFTLPAGTTAHTANTCLAGNATSSIALAGTDAQATFYVSATRSAPAPGGPQVQNVVANLASQSATLSLTVNPGLPTLSVATPAGAAATTTAGACVPVTLERRDALGNLVPLPSAANVTLQTTPTGVALFASTDCSGASTVAVPVSAGASTRNFSLRSTRSYASLNLSLQLDGQSTPLSLVVNPGALSELAVLGLPGSMTAGDCIPLTIRRRDANANDITNGAATVTMTSTQFTFSSTAGCAGATASLGVSIADGQSISAAFYARATTSGSATMTATISPITGTGTLTVNPAAPTLNVTVPVGGVATVTANTCVPVTVERRDAFNNPVPLGSPGNLTVTPPANLTLFNSTNCTGSVVTQVPVAGSASSSAFSVRTTVANPSLVLTVTLGGQTDTVTLTVNPGPTFRLLVEGMPGTLTAGGCTGQVSVRRQDEWGNNVTSEPTLSVALSSARFTFSTQAGCASPTVGGAVTIANGSALSAEPLFVTATAAGSGTVTASATAPGGPVTGSATATVNPAAASKFFILGSGGTATAGACSGAIQVEARDSFDNQITPASGSPIAVTLGSSPGTLTFFPSGTCTGTLPLQLTNAQRVGTFSFIATSAPSTETIQASGALTASTQNWTINVGVPTQLAWKTNPPASAARFACVSAGVIQTLDSSNNVSPHASGVTVTPTATAGGAVTFFSDVGCTTPVTTFSIPGGMSETAPIYMVASGSGSTTLSATSTPALTAAPNRAVNITGAQGTLEVVASSEDLEAGGCVTLTVTREVAAAASTLGNSAVDVSVPNGTTAVTLYPSTDCTGTGALTLSRVISHGASTTVVSARGRSTPQAALPLDVIVTAADPQGGYSNGTDTVKAYPLVRRGTCHITATNDDAVCVLQPPIPGDAINRSFLVFTSTGSPDTTSPPGSAASEQSVECHLDQTGGASVVCSRSNTGGNSSAQVSVQYQVVSWGRDFAGGGVSVQHFPAVATSAATTNQAISAVDQTSSFILLSSKHSGENDADAFPVARFTSNTNVEILTNSSAAHTVSLQVVSFAGASVSSTSATNQTGQPTVTVTTPNTATGTTFALATATVGDGSAANLMCKRKFRVAVPSATTVTLRRGADAMGTTCSADAVTLVNVQRVSIPTATVTAPAAVSISGTNTSATSATFTAITPHRTIVFFGQQGPGGQTSGEGAFAGTANDDDDTGPFHATAELNGTTAVTVTRTAPPSPGASSSFTPFVVQFNP